MAEIDPGEYIDTYVNLPSKEPQSEEDMDPNIREWFLKSSPDLIGGVTTEHWVNKMTAAGIERGLLNFSLTRGWTSQRSRPPHRSLWMISEPSARRWPRSADRIRAVSSEAATLIRTTA